MSGRLKPYLLTWRKWRFHQFLDGIKNYFELLIMPRDRSGQFGQGQSHILMYQSDLAQAIKSTHDLDAGRDSNRTIKDCGEHNGAMFGKSQGRLPTAAMAAT